MSMAFTMAGSMWMQVRKYISASVEKVAFMKKLIAPTAMVLAMPFSIGTAFN